MKLFFFTQYNFYQTNVGNLKRYLRYFYPLAGKKLLRNEKRNHF